MCLDDVVGPIRDEARLHGESEHDEGEVLTVLGPDGEESSHVVEADSSGPRATRRTRHRNRYRQVKKVEELDACRRVLEAIGETLGLDLVCVEPADEATHPWADAWAVSADGRRVALQVTRPDARVWGDIARGAAHHEALTEAALFDELADNVASTKTWGGSAGDIVLVLDGWGVLAPGAARRLAARHYARFAALGFLAVWYSNRGPGPESIRLDEVPIMRDRDRP